MDTDDTTILETLRQHAHPLARDTRDWDPLLARIGDARFVLLGEASHGTHEFYRARAAITQRLIAERGFCAVVVEADWPDAYRVNRWVRGQSEDRGAAEALGDFGRFPTWMWRNEDVEAFTEWLRDWNVGQGNPQRQAGFYGMDLYSLFTSMEAVLAFLDETDPEAAARARYRYSCFDHFGEDSQAYGYAASFGLVAPCEDEVIAQLGELQRRGSDASMAEDEWFFAEQNARLVKNAEQYYRSMFQGRASSWNLRDAHMVETLAALADHLSEQRGEPARLVVWAHNSHLGDARATQMGRAGEWNVGQLVREQWGEQAVLVGFSTYTGSVTAADDWGDPPRRKSVRPALPGSYERLFHEVGGDFMLSIQPGGEVARALRGPRLERAIGVIYRPDTERISHYFDADLAAQFDAVIHFDHTHALTPLDPTPTWHATEQLPDTFPTGM